MPLFLSGLPDPFKIKVHYIKDELGNTVAVTISIDVWNKIISRYRDLFADEDAETNFHKTSPTH